MSPLLEVSQQVTVEMGFTSPRKSAHSSCTKSDVRNSAIDIASQATQSASPAHYWPKHAPAPVHGCLESDLQESKPSCGCPFAQCRLVKYARGETIRSTYNRTVWYNCPIANMRSLLQHHGRDKWLPHYDTECSTPFIQCVWLIGLSDMTAY